MGFWTLGSFGFLEPSRGQFERRHLDPSDPVHKSVYHIFLDVDVEDPLLVRPYSAKAPYELQSISWIVEPSFHVG